ncbi:helix-turn-helix domain-containing protein [Enemella evansiae]|uniref:ArsR family transcriptional regulator n=1 Tax=Enemella evansiae TaxID=2016499 RepID=UPI000B9707B2|nr:ArsR family transcriptional regulator [Enemella evansiae]OYO02430.1 transcriptional regulator [Enemella evansiae]
MEIESVVTDALESVGVEAYVPPTEDSVAADLMLDIDGITTLVELKRRALVDGAAAATLLGQSRAENTVLLAIGDRVTEEARSQLLHAGAGFLDLRGRLGLRARGIVINADVPTARGTRQRTDALAGKAGMEVATQLLMSPSAPTAVRQLARDLNRSPSTVSEVLAAFRDDGLIDQTNTVVDTRLFWRVAEMWPGGRIYLGRQPSGEDAKTLRLGLGDAETTSSGWALTDTAAAAAYGAPVAFRAGQQLDFFVPDDSVAQRAIRLLGAAPPGSRPAVSIRVAPVPAAVEHRIADATVPPGWPLAHPVLVALDLAQDPGRGREILDAWTPDERWPRVW